MNTLFIGRRTWKNSEPSSRRGEFHADADAIPEIAPQYRKGRCVSRQKEYGYVKVWSVCPVSEKKFRTVLADSIYSITKPIFIPYSVREYVIHQQKCEFLLR